MIRVGVYTDLNWSLGRIATSILRYLPRDKFIVTLLDWSQCAVTTWLFVQEGWRQFDVVLSTTSILFSTLQWGYKLPLEFQQRVAAVTHFPVLDDPIFKESIPEYITDVHFASVNEQGAASIEATGRRCEAVVAFGVDLADFVVQKQPRRPLRVLGFVGRDDLSENNKRHLMFEAICRETGLKPMFINQRSHLEHARLYDGIDCLVVCSHLEGGPLGPFECAALGIPCITTRVGNVQKVNGMKTFDSVSEASKILLSWAEDSEAMWAYANAVQDEVVANWTNKVLIRKHLAPWLATISALSAL